MGVTGCPESEDVELTIMSSRVNGSPLFKWKRNGEVERVIHSYMVNCFHIVILIFKIFLKLSGVLWPSTISPK